MITHDAVKRCLVHLTLTDVRKATVYIEPDLVVKAARQHRFGLRERSTTYVVTIGKPNYEEREFIKKCKAAKESFPIKKVQLKYYLPKVRKKAA